VPTNAARQHLRAILEFDLASVPVPSWDALEALAPPISARDSLMLVQMGGTRGDRQPRVPLTLHLDANGQVKGDTTLLLGTRRLRVQLERIDTLSATPLF
jgi:hypothetical protein